MNLFKMFSKTSEVNKYEEIFKSISWGNGTVYVAFEVNGVETSHYASSNYVNGIDMRGANYSYRPFTFHEDFTLHLNGIGVRLNIPEENREEVERCLYLLGKEGQVINRTQFNNIKKMVLSSPDFQDKLYDYIKHGETVAVKIPVIDENDLGEILFTKGVGDVGEELTYYYGVNKVSIHLDYSIRDVKIIEHLGDHYLNDLLEDKFKKLVGE